MKIAFDINGTLLGPQKILALYQWCKDQGHDLTVWSNCYAYINQTIRYLRLDPDTKRMSKVYLYENDNQPLFDIAIDDEPHSSKGLAAKRIILVRDVPEDINLFKNLIK